MPLTDSDCAATYKILVLGDTTVGKSSILRTLTGKDFVNKTLPTVGIDFVRRTFEVDGAVVKLNVWDTAGQQRFHSVTRKHYRGVQGIVLVYDITDRKSFTHLSFWVDSVNKGITNSKNQYDTVPIILVGNKSDLEKDRQIEEEEGKELATKILAFDFIETSAKKNENVFMMFKRLAQYVTETFDPKVMKSYHPYMLRPPEIMEEKRKQNDNSKKKKKKKKEKTNKQDNNKSKKDKLLTSPCAATEHSNGHLLENEITNCEEHNQQKNGKIKKKSRGLKLTKRKLRIIKTTNKNKRKKKKKTLGFLWRKLFRRKQNSSKRESDSSYGHTSRHEHSCAIL
ncbi:ras-related protein Rab-8A-like [Mytilus galloprovincialis]|uniref:ras-related protein Rab-8A-like n=1 Tax=Mytilus galloprovincialis TaxID=29158 RepID=UPI003F7BED9C